MAITVRDIHEKEFSKQKFDGYDVVQVDDFLDEVANQLDALLKENASLKQKATVEAPVEVEVFEDASADDAYDEPSYFKNLEKAMRETLISSQRIADDAVADARKKAHEILTEAQDKADTLTIESKAELNKLKDESERYRTEMRKLIEQHESALNMIKSALS